jgi:hypothetical protein
MVVWIVKRRNANPPLVLSPEATSSRKQSQARSSDSSGTGRTTKFFVAQISNLPYRQIPFGRARKYPRCPHWRKACGLEIRDTAGCNPALRAEEFCGASSGTVWRGDAGHRALRRFSLSRNVSIELGSAPASGAAAGASPDTSESAKCPRLSARKRAEIPTGEGAGRHTRGRVCSPLQTVVRRGSP